MNLPEQLPPPMFAAAFAAIDEPAPSEIGAITREGTHAIYRITFEEPGKTQAILRIEQDARRRSSIPVELTAMKRARSVLPVPNARALTGLPWPALLLEHLPGKVRRTHRTLGRRLVDALLVLNNTPCSSWGDLVLHGHFTPSETSWRRYWERRIEQAFAQAHSSNTGLGWAEQLYTAALKNTPALDDASFSLVHGDFGPDNLLLNPTGEITAVLDWDDALQGDPLVDWVSCLDAPAKVLAMGIHKRLVPVFENAGAIERLQVYHRTRALERFAECGRAWNHEPGSRRRAQHLEAAVALARVALRPDHVKRRIGSIQGAHPDVPGPTPIEPHRILRRRVFEILRHPLPPVALPLASALAACAAGADLFAQQASKLLRTLPIQREPWAPAPIQDWAGLRDSTPAGSGVGLALLALAEHAFDAVGQHVDDSSRRGLLEQVRLSDTAGWRDAVVGYAAAAVLDHDQTPFMTGLEQVPDDLLAEPDEVVDGLVFAEWLDSTEAIWVPLLCWALPHLPDAVAERVAGQVLG